MFCQADFADRQNGFGRPVDHSPSVTTLNRIELFRFKGMGKWSFVDIFKHIFDFRSIPLQRLSAARFSVKEMPVPKNLIRVEGR